MKVNICSLGSLGNNGFMLWMSHSSFDLVSVAIREGLPSTVF